MCVTPYAAQITATRVYVYAASPNRHVLAYQNHAESLVPHGNCMILDVAGYNLNLVQAATQTRSLMDDVTAGLRKVIEERSFTRGAAGVSFEPTVQAFGDYDVVIADTIDGMLTVLDRVQPDRRPPLTKMHDQQRLYRHHRPGHMFIMACFDGTVRPTHPIVVEYTPNDPRVLTAPGLDGHDGTVPRPGDPVITGFKIAFGARGLQLPHVIRYNDEVSEEWAPASVTGYIDNALSPNGSYELRLSDLRAVVSPYDVLPMVYKRASYAHTS
jgi:hypothetical protein